MGERVNLKLQEAVEEAISKISINVFRGNKTETINKMLLEAINNNSTILIGGVPTSVQTILSDNVLDWDLTYYSSNLSHDFKTNVSDLRYEYQSALHKFLFVLTKFFGDEENKRGCYISTADNLNYYFTDYTLEDQDKNGLLNFYCNIRGVIGKDNIADYLAKQNCKYRICLTDPASRIWLGRYSQFKLTSWANPKGEQFFEELLDALGLNKRLDAVQLHYSELQYLAKYLSKVMTKKNHSNASAGDADYVI